MQKKSPDADSDHGGHGSGDFAWSASCGTSDCHDSASNTDVVSDIHGNTGAITSPLYTERTNSCENCHVTSAGGARTGGNGVNGYVGDATLATSGLKNETCIDCHTGTIPAIHHTRDFENASGRNWAAPGVASRVRSGNCHLCHTDGNGPNAHGDTNVTGSRPTLLPCGTCHVNNTGAEFQIKKYDISVITTAGSADSDSPDPWVGSAVTHVIPNLGSPITIQDYGVCFYCHGDSGNKPANYGSAIEVVPFHGFDPAFHTLDERDAANQPQIRVALHPGHINYFLFADALSPAANQHPNSGAPMNDRFNDSSWNEKIYDLTDFDGSGNSVANSCGDHPKDLGKSGVVTDTCTFTKYLAQWPLGVKLRTLLGNNFLPVATQSIPHTIGVGGPKLIPASP